MVRWLIQAHIHGKSWTDRDRTSAYGNIPRNHGNATSNQEKHRKFTKTKSQLKAKHYKSSQQNQPRNHSNTRRAHAKILRTQVREIICRCQQRSGKRIQQGQIDFSKVRRPLEMSWKIFQEDEEGKDTTTHQHHAAQGNGRTIEGYLQKCKEKVQNDQLQTLTGSLSVLPKRKSETLSDDRATLSLWRWKTSLQPKKDGEKQREMKSGKQDAK